MLKYEKGRRVRLSGTSVKVIEGESVKLSIENHNAGKGNIVEI